MIKGYLDEENHPRIEVTVIGSTKRITTDAVIDTGFDGDLYLPVSLAVQLGLELRDVLPVELADGSIRNELVFAGSLLWGGEEREVEVILTESKDALVGMGLLTGKRLEIDLGTRRVEIEESKGAGR